MIPSQDQIPYNGIESVTPARATVLCSESQDQIPYNGIERPDCKLIRWRDSTSQDQIPYNGIESRDMGTRWMLIECKGLKTKFRITELKVTRTRGAD